MIIPCSRTQFIESWLGEMPEGTPHLDSYPNLLYAIQERMQLGQMPQEIKPGLYKLPGQQVNYYWYGSPTQIDLAAEVDRTPQSLVLTLLGKNPQLKTGAPYASDLYVSIVEDSDLSLLVSDEKLSDEGLKVWKRLVQQGYGVTVFDKHQPGATRETFTSPDQLDQFFKKGDAQFRRYRYVLSKPREQLWETVSVFNTRRYRELAGMENP